MALDTKLFVNKQSGGMFNVIDRELYPGNIFWVDSGNSDASDAASFGANPQLPFATLDFAVSQCTASNGDVIFLMPGHAESKAAAGSIFALDVAGISVVGLGEGAARPTFTFSHTGVATTISAASISVKNIVLVAGVDSITAPMTISAADWQLIDVEWRDTTDVEFVRAFLTDANADRGLVKGCYYNGYEGGNANVNFARLVGNDSVTFEDCKFLGKVTTAVIEFHTTLCTKIVVKNCDFHVDSTTDFTKNIVDTVTGSTWSMYDNFDMGAEANFSGGTGGVASDDVSAVKTDTAAILVDTGTTLPATLGTPADTDLATDIANLDALLPQLATANSTANLTDGDIFTFTKSIEIIAIIGRMTTVHPAAANTCKLTITPDAFAAYDICGATDLTGMDAGTLLSITGTAAGGLVVTDAVGAIAPGQANPVYATCVTNGVISTVFSDTGNQSGAIKWMMLWRPLEAGATVA